jgi:hypothetical protein
VYLDLGLLLIVFALTILVLVLIVVHLHPLLSIPLEKLRIILQQIVIELFETRG